MRTASPSRITRSLAPATRPITADASADASRGAIPAAAVHGRVRGEDHAIVVAADAVAALESTRFVNDGVGRARATKSTFWVSQRCRDPVTRGKLVEAV